MFKLNFNLDDIGQTYMTLKQFLPFLNNYEKSKGEIPCEKADKLTYDYYIGTIELYRHRFDLAESHLSNAFIKSLHYNKRLILIKLIAARLVFGVVPQPKLLEKYNLQEYSAITHHYKKGDLKGYNIELFNNGRFFRKYGVFTILQHWTKIVLYRNLFGRMYNQAN